MGEKLKGAILSDEGVHRGSVVYLPEITSGNIRSDVVKVEARKENSPASL
jgi:hypothetical protein